MSSSQRAVALVVGLLAVVAVVVVFVVATGGPIGRAPEATDAATPSASGAATPLATADQSAEPTTTADPSAPDDEDALAILTEIEEQVVAIRGLEPADIGPPEILTREEARAELEALFDEEYPAEERERDNFILRALGLLDEGEDVAELQLQLLGDQVLGFYDDVDKRMVVVTDSGLDPEARMTYAHEYTHALQDANFTLDSLEMDVAGEDDRGLARTALVEGDATVTMLAWALTHLTPEELLQIGTGAEIPDMSGIPSWMVRQLEFPYVDGQMWVSSMTGGSLTSPDFSSVDAAWADPPDSTEQVMVSGAWDPREEPIPVDVPDIAGALGDGWEELDASPVGQATIEIILQHHGAAAEAIAAARGWGGDQLVVARGPEDEFAVAWRLAWDTPEDAAQFADAYRVVVEELPFPASVTELPDGTVVVAHASDEEILAVTEVATAGR
jgi:hypothetical protein